MLNIILLLIMSYISKKPFILTKMLDTQTLVTAETLNILSGVIKFQDKFNRLIKIDKNRYIYFAFVKCTAISNEKKKILPNGKLVENQLLCGRD